MPIHFDYKHFACREVQILAFLHFPGFLKRIGGHRVGYGAVCCLTVYVWTSASVKMSIRRGPLPPRRSHWLDHINVVKMSPCRFMFHRVVPNIRNQPKRQCAELYFLPGIECAIPFHVVKNRAGLTPGSRTGFWLEASGQKSLTGLNPGKRDRFEAKKSRRFRGFCAM